MLAHFFARLIIRNPKTVITGFLLVLLASVFPALQLRTDFNLEGFYQDEDPVVMQYAQLEDEFGRDDNRIVIGYTREDLMSSEGMEQNRALHAELETLPFILDVQSLSKAERMTNLEDQLVFTPYFDSETIYDEPLFTELKEDPFVTGFLINDALTSTAFYVEVDQEQNTYTNRNELISRLTKIVRQFETNSDLQVHISGIPYFRNLYVNMLNSEIIFYISISSVLIIALLWYLYRSIWGVVLPMIIVWSTLLLTLALIHITGGYIEIMSSTIAPILLCVGIADSIHMISKYDDARDQGLSKQDSIVEMIRTLGSATFLTSLTTAIGFITLMSSTIMPMKRFGIYTASGVLIAYLVTIFFLPAALSLSKRARIFSEQKSPFFRWSSRQLSSLSRINETYKISIILFSLLLLSVSAWQMTGLTVNGRVFDDVSEETQVMQDQAWFSEHLVPILPLEILIRTGTEEGTLSADLMQRIAETEKFLMQVPEIEKVTSGKTLLAQVHHVLNPHQAFLSVASTPLLAQYLLLLEISGTDVVEELFTFSYETIRITAMIKDAGSERINEIRRELHLHLTEYYPGEEISVTGSTVLSADLVGKIVRSLMTSMGLAIGLISVLMALLFRNVRMMLIALVPNLLPLVVTGAVMAFFGVDIKPSTAVIFTIAFGIAVDDSIHFLARFRVEMSRGSSLHEALSITLHKTGRAIIITSMILLAGFGSLISSDFVSTAMMGVMVSSTIFSALIADLLLLPALFHWLEPDIRHLNQKSALKANVAAPTP